MNESHNRKYTLQPKFGFPEFKGKGSWEEKSLGELLIKNSTKNKDGKYLLVESVSNKFGFIKQDEYFENRIIASKDTSNYYVIKKGFFAYNPSRIDVGSLAYKFDDNISIISPLYVSFKANNKFLNDIFLLSFFNTIGFTSQLIFEGGVRNTLNYENLIRIRISYPSFAEQQKIADTLSSLDELISAEAEKLKALKTHKKGLMQQLFPPAGEAVPKLRFPEFKDSGEWEVKKLKEVCYVNPTSGNLPANFVYIDLESVQEGELLQKKTINLSEAPSRAQRLLKNGDVLFQMVRPYQQNNFLFKTDNEFDYVASTGYAQLRAFESEIFLYQFLHNQLFLDDVLSNCTGSNYPAINSSALSEIVGYFPKLVEQQKIASCLSSLDELIAAQSKKIDSLRQHKKGLMQGLFPAMA